MNTERRQAGRRSLSPLSLARRLHADERGSLSIMGVFAIFFLTVLLGMIFNVGRQVDDKLRMQNAADAAVYSGTLTVSRGMNAIAYSNHLLCEIFALTAYMREAANEYNSTQLPDWDAIKSASEHQLNLAKLAEEHKQILERAGEKPPPAFEGDALDVWEFVGRNAFVEIGTFAGLGNAPFDKFVRLGEAILAKIPLERQMVRTFEPMAREHSRLTLTVFEYILGGNPPIPVPVTKPMPMVRRDDPQSGFQGGLIPRFQRSVIRFTPEMSQRIAQEIAKRHGRATRSQHRNRDLTAVLYRSDATRFDEYREERRDTRLLPVVDPNELGGDLNAGQTFDPRFYSGYVGLNDEQLYFKLAYDKRTRLAKHYLDEWIYHWLHRYFTQRHLEKRFGKRGAGPYGRDVASLSQLANFWKIFTCAQLNKMLHVEFPKSNLPFVIRVNDRQNWSFANPEPRFIPDEQALLAEYQCVAVVAWPHTRQFGPGIYRNPFNGDKRTVADDTYALTFAQAKFFLPRPRYRCCPWGRWVRTGPPLRTRQYIPYFDYWPGDWSTFNQNWRTKLVPTWNDQLPEILTQHPRGNVNDLSTPELRRLGLRDLHLLNSH